MRKLCQDDQVSEIYETFWCSAFVAGVGFWGFGRNCREHWVFSGTKFSGPGTGLSGGAFGIVLWFAGAAGLAGNVKRGFVL
jgi:hypothetical protein